MRRESVIVTAYRYSYKEVWSNGGRLSIEGNPIADPTVSNSRQPAITLHRLRNKCRIKRETLSIEVQLKDLRPRIMSHVRQTILIAVLSSVGSLVWSQESMQNPPQPMSSSPSAGTSLFWTQLGLPAVGEPTELFSQTEQLPTSPSDGSPRAVLQSNVRPPINMTWHSDRFQHQRLLFEEPKLERQGISRAAPVQLVESSTKFFTKSVLFPFAWTLGLHRQPENSK